MDLGQQLTAALGGVYRIERELGGGGMSRVFLAEDTALQRRVVIKVLAPELAAGINTERFKRETLLSAQLQHPQIVPVLTAGDVAGMPYLVMPYVVGESLRHRLEQVGALPRTEALTILRDVARALAYAHAAGVVHRDIKPENVLLSQGSAAVSDFGIAKALSSARNEPAHETLTMAGTSLGTPQYMAPEQIAADPNADHRSDIYSFGIMGYELIAGHTPFHGRPRAALITAHLTEPPTSLLEAAPGTPAPLARLVMRCLAKDPADRPGSAREIVEALDSIEITGTSRLAAPTVRRRRLPLFAAAATLVVILAAGAVALARAPWGDQPRPLDARVVAVLPFRVVAADPTLHYLQEGMMDLLAAKLTGEGGLRATEPRSVLDEWRNQGSGDGRDLAASQSMGIATRVGAGLMLLGDVVGTPTRVTLRGSLLRVPSGAQVVQVSEEGPPDSLAWIIDRFAARLMSEAAGEGGQRVAGLTSTSLPALRAYLDGQVLLRRGDAVSAARAFERAIETDSTFALAGIGLIMATSWYGDPQLGGRGIDVAWRERQRLSPRDRVLLEALAGPRHPEQSTVQETFTVRQRYAQLAPDRAEAWYLIGDQIFHYGTILGVSDPSRRAYEYFVRASEIDSSYVVGYIHAPPLALLLGDTAQEQRMLRLRLAADTARGWHVQHRLLRAHLRGDSTVVRAIRDSLGDDYRPLSLSLIQFVLYDGRGSAAAWQTVQDAYEDASSADRRFVARQVHDLALTFGKPATAAGLLEVMFDSATDLNADILRVRNAMLGLGDADAARAAARRLAAFDARPLPTDTMELELRRGAIRALEPWRIASGDTTHVAQSLERLSTIARLRNDRGAERTSEIALIEAMHLHAAGSPRAPQALARLDSLLAALPYSSGAMHHGRASFASIMLARMYEQRGDPRRAFAAGRRRAESLGFNNPYIGIQVLEEGRLAEAAGERDVARRAYAHAVRMMFDADESLQPALRSAREALARLERSEGR